MVIRTKIICTIGPGVNSREKMRELVAAGMNVARLNLSHGDREQHAKTIEDLKAVREELGVPLAIMLDTKGPEVRVGKLQDGQVRLERGSQVKLTAKEVEGTADLIHIHPGSVIQDIDEGMKVLFDDGYISGKVLRKDSDSLTLEIENSGTLKSGKGVNIPNAMLDLPVLTEKDIADVEFGCEHDVGVVAVSFIRAAEDIVMVRNLLKSRGAHGTTIIAKIENSEAVRNFDSIVQVADGIMVARGDLGVEVPLSTVPRLQKMMIRKSNFFGKPSVTATQMLESMIVNPRPTRAEVSDVANAIYDSSSAVMLSGETAVGAFPIAAVETMVRIAKEAERDFDYDAFYASNSNRPGNDIPTSVALASLKTAYATGAKAILAITTSGGTARLLSSFRPKMPIFALTDNQKSFHQLSCIWGVIPFFLADKVHNVQEGIEKLSQFALEKGLVQVGDLVVATAGEPFGIKGTTNMLRVESIGDVLVRGTTAFGEKAYGKVAIALSPDGLKLHSSDDFILVLTQCDDSYLPLIRRAKGIILQNYVDDHQSENYVMAVAKALDIPALTGATGACTVLKNGTFITLDPEKKIVLGGFVEG